jgi:hypothetical protein
MRHWETSQLSLSLAAFSASKKSQQETLGQNLLDDLELIPQSTGHWSWELPSLLERLLQSGTRGLQVSPCCLGWLERTISPSSSFLLNPFALLGLVADDPSKAVNSSHDFKAEVQEMSLGFFLILVLCNEAALQWRWETDPCWGTKFLELLKAEPDLLKTSASPRVICMPGLTHVRDNFSRVWMRGSSPAPCITIANGSPWVTSSLLRVTRRNRSLPARVTRVASWRWQLKTHSHSRCTAQGINVLFPSLNASLFVGAFLPKKFFGSAHASFDLRPEHN